MSFTIKDISISLDPSSIESAIRQVEEIRNRIQPAMMHLIDKLTEKGVEVARAELIFFEPPAYYTGELSGSLKSIPAKDGTGYVVTDCEYAIYVEYGTGWGFNAANEEGIGRIGKPIHQYGWYYFNKKDGKRHFTDGMAFRPFMHNTFEDIVREAEAAGGRVVAEYLAGDDGA